MKTEGERKGTGEGEPWGGGPEGAAAAPRPLRPGAGLKRRPAGGALATRPDPPTGARAGGGGGKGRAGRRGGPGLGAGAGAGCPGSARAPRQPL